MCVNSEGSGETAWKRKLAWAIAGCLCDKYHNLMSWLKLWYWSTLTHIRSSILTWFRLVLHVRTHLVPGSHWRWLVSRLVPCLDSWLVTGLRINTCLWVRCGSSSGIRSNWNLVRWLLGILVYGSPRIPAFVAHAADNNNNNDADEDNCSDYTAYYNVGSLDHCTDNIIQIRIWKQNRINASVIKNMNQQAYSDYTEGWNTLI